MIQIGRKDIIWNYGATFLKIASSAILLPFILRMMPSEMVGIWSVFMMITVFSNLLDFGFNPSFTRNITYIFSGVRILKTEGFDSVSNADGKVDYGLLKGLIIVMRWFYFRMGIVLFLLLATLGTFYIHSLLENYHGNHRDVYIAWALLCLINSYNLFTLYYDSLLQGRGLIKRSKQIVIIGQSVYLVIASSLIIAGYGLIAIVMAQASSVVIIRWLAMRSFFTNEIKQELKITSPDPPKAILKVIYPNAVKIGLTSLGGFMVTRSAIVIGSLYLPLEDIASYGITMQLIGVISGLAVIYTSTYQPKIAQLRISVDNYAIKELYLKGQIIMFITFLAGGIVLSVFGESALNLIGSQTRLIPPLLIVAASVVSFLESNHSTAGMILLTKNEVPFFKASLISGAGAILFLLVFFHLPNPGLWVLIAAPGFAQGVYQNWKWPSVVYNELEISKADVITAVKRIYFRKSITIQKP